MTTVDNRCRPRHPSAVMIPLAQVVREHAHARGNAVALEFGDVRRTYADLADRAARIASTLRTRDGVGRGARIGILACNDGLTFGLLGAASALGAAIVPFNLRLAPRELDAIVAIARPKVLFVDRAHAENREGVPLDDASLLSETRFE